MHLNNALIALPILSLRICSLLQRVSREVPLDRVLEGVGTLEELCALLLAQGPLGGIHVFVQKLPELIRHVENLEVLGQP